MRVLVATRNRDKFNIIRRMVEDAIPDVFLISLADAEISGDVVECGTIRDRALQKAEYFMRRLEWSKRPESFDAVLASDDGISVDNGESMPNSKELTDCILSGEWPQGTLVSIVRAFALIKQGETPRVEVTSIPFVFLGNPKGIKRENGTYPLSRVLSPIGGNIPIGDFSEVEENQFNLKHSESALRRLFS